METARAAELFLADGVVVTGAATGEPADVNAVRAVRAAVGCHVLVGSGVTAANVDGYLPACQAIIVGSSLKHQGSWRNHVDAERVRAFMHSVAAHR